MITYFNIAIKSLLLNKVRSALTMLGVIIGVSAVIILTSIVGGVQKSVTSAFNSLGSNSLFVFAGDGEGNQGPTGVAVNKLEYDMVRKLRIIPNVTDASVIVATSGISTYGNKELKAVQIRGVDIFYENASNLELSDGRFLNEAEINGVKMVAVIGATLKKELFGNSDPIGKEIKLKDKKFTIIGVAAEKGAILGADQDKVAYIPYTVSKQKFQIDRPTYFFIKTKDVKDLPKAKRDVEETIGKVLKKDEFAVRSQEEGLKFFNNILGVLATALGGIAAISLLVGGVGIMNIMFVSVTERTREIGLRKAIGANSSNILTQFLLEAVILSLLGGILGVLVGWGGTLALGRFLDTSVNLFFVMLSFGVSAIIGIVFGVAPAIKASRLDPITALRYE